MNPTEMHAEILLPDEHRSAPRSWGGEPESKRRFASAWEATIYGTDAKGLVLELGFLRTYLPAGMTAEAADKARTAEMKKVEKALSLAIQGVQGGKPKFTQLAVALRDAALKHPDLAAKFKKAKRISYGEFAQVWQMPSEQSQKWGGSYLDKTKKELAGLAEQAGPVVDDLLNAMDGSRQPARTAAGRGSSLLEKAHREAEILAGRLAPDDDEREVGALRKHKSPTAPPPLDFGNPAVRNRLLDALSDSWKTGAEVAQQGFPNQFAVSRKSTVQTVIDELEHLALIGRVDARRDSEGRALYRSSGHSARGRDVNGREFNDLSEKVQKEARRMGASMSGRDDDECVSGRDAFLGSHRTTGNSEPGSGVGADDSFRRYMETLRKLTPTVNNPDKRAEGSDIDF